MATDLESALLAAHVYSVSPDVRSERNSLPLPTGWELVPDGDFQDLTTGYMARAYRHLVTGEIVIAYAGTTSEPPVLLDWVYGNVPGALGVALAPQILNAATTYLDIRARFPSASISFSGHSLGGGLASVMSVFFDRAATVFDTAPFSLSADSGVVVNALRHELGLLGYNLGTAFQTYQPGVVISGGAGLQASPTRLARQSKIRHIRVVGEALSEPFEVAVGLFDVTALGPAAGSIGRFFGAQEEHDPLAVAAEGWGLLKMPIALHSITLLTAFLQSPALLKTTRGQPTLLPAIFTSALNNIQDFDTRDTKFLELMVQRHYVGQGSLDVFARDVMLVKTSGLTADQLVSRAALSATVAGHYKQGLDLPASSTAQFVPFLDSVPGGIGFDLRRARADDVEAARITVQSVRDALALHVNSLRYRAGTTGPAWVTDDKDGWFLQSGISGMHASGLRDAGNVMIGWARVDRLTGGDRADLLLGDAGDDVLIGGEGADTLAGGPDRDILDGTVGDDVIYGGEGEDHLFVGAGSTYLNGGSGRDYFYVRDSGTGTHRIADFAPTSQERVFAIIGDETVPLFGLYRRQGTSNIWASPDGRTSVTINSPATVTVTGGPSVVIDNFAPGDLGITLLDAPLPRSYIDPGTAGDDILHTPSGAVNIALYGQEGADRLYAGEMADSELFGGSGDDVLAGGLNGYFEGGAGDDLMGGGWGADILFGGEGSDLIAGGGVFIAGPGWAFRFDGPRTVFAEATTARLSIAPGTQPGQVQRPKYLSGGPGEDRIWGGDFDDLIDGGADGDHLTGFPGSDVILGGDGNDSIWGDSTQNPDRPDGFFTEPEFHGDDFADGGAGDDFITGDGGADTLFGGAGADVLNGDDSFLDEIWHGADYLDGGEGDDTIFGYGKGDTIFGGAGADNLYGDSDTTPWDKHAADYLDGGDGNDVISGDGGADTLLGGAGDDQLFGDADNVPVAYQGGDFLDGGAGADYLRGYAGDDTLVGGEGDDQLLAEDGDDALDGGDGADSLDGGPGRDTLLGGAGADELAGGEGDDVLDGGAGADRMVGGPGNDTYLADATDVIVDVAGANTVEFAAEVGFDTLSARLLFVDGQRSLVLATADHDLLAVAVGGPVDLFTFRFADGANLSGGEAFAALFTEGLVVYGTAEGETLSGYGGDDLVYGFEGADTLYGFAGADTLEGGDGEDTLVGGAGDDLVQGGLGQDTYRFGLGDGNDTVLDQGDVGEPDTLALGAGLAPQDVEVLRQANGDLVVRLRASGESVRMPGWYGPYSPNRVERILFEDETEIGEAELEALGVAPLVGTEASDLLVGTGAADTLVGLGGNDTLDGAAGEDLLQGGSGLDTYVLAWGMGRDRVEEDAGEGGIVDLAPGLDLAALSLERDGADLFLRIRGTREGLLLAGYFDAPSPWTVRAPGGSERALGEFLAEREATPLDPIEGLRAEYLGGIRRNFVATYAGFGFAPSGPDAMRQRLTDLFQDVDHVTTVTTTSLGLAGPLGASTRLEGLSVPTGPYLRLLEERLEFGRIETDEASFSQGSIPESSFVSVIGQAHAMPVRTESTYLGSLSDIGLLDPPIETAAGPVFAIRTDQVFERRVTTYRVLDGAGGATTGDATVQGRITDFAEVVGGAGANALSEVRLADGGAGDDTLRAAGWGIALESPLDPAEVVPGNGALLYGNDGADALRGSFASDLLAGGAGDDVINGGDGADGYYVFADHPGWDLLWDSGQLDPEVGGAESWFRSWYSNRYGTDAPELPADDPLVIESGAVKADTVFFGPGIGLAGLAVRRIELAEAGVFDGFPSGARAALEVSWAPGAGVRVILADPDRDEYGEGIERFRFADGTTRTLTEMLALASVANRTPELALPIADQAADEDVPFAFSLPAGTFADPDAGDPLTLVALLEDGAALPEWLAFDAGSGAFAGTPTNAEVGSYSIRVSAADPAGESVSDVFTLTVANTNDAPTVANPPADRSATEDVYFSVAFPDTAFADVDAGESLAWSARLAAGAGLPAWLAFDPLTRTLAGLPGNGEVGSYRIRLVATDLAGAQAAAEFTLSVANVNDAPTLANPLADRTTEERSAFAWTVPGTAFADIDPGEVLAYAARLASGAALPGWLGFDPITRTLSGTPGEYDIGTAAIRISATDSAGASATDEFQLTVTAKPGRTLTGTSGANTIVGSDGADTIRAGGGADTVYGNEGQDALYGEDGNDRLYGWTGHDLLDGGAGADKLYGDEGDDRLFGGAGNDELWGWTGRDELHGGDNADLLGGDAGEDLLYGEAGNDELYGGADRDYLSGGANADYLEGNDGADLLQGEAGNDDLLGGSGNDLLDPGANSDVADGGEGSDFLAAGTGNDTFLTGAGADVLAYNRGDGQDTVRTTGAGGKTVSLGGGITYTDLSLEQSGIDLLLHVGAGEKLTLDDWYAAPANRGFLTLQLVAEAMAGFNPASADPLLNRKVQAFDFAQLVSAFDAARAADPAIGRWALMDRLLDAHLAGSDTEALGGDLAYRYGKSGTLAGIGTNAAQAVLGEAGFGTQAQSLRPLATLQEGPVKLT